MKVAVVLALLFLSAALIGGAAWLWTPDRPRSALEARYSRPGDFLTVAGLRLHVRDSGPNTAPVLVLLHGFGSSLHTWEPWANALSSRHRVIRFDLPGFGLTGADPSGRYTAERSVEVVAALMDRLGVAKASLIGHSMGGKVAWRFAARHPDRVDRLVLISPDGFASPGLDYGKRQHVPAFARLMRYALPKAFLRMNLTPAYGDPANLTDAIVTRYHDLILAPGVRDAMIARMEQMEVEDPEPLLRRIQAPTLLVWGEKDAMIPFSNAADYARILPDATLASFPALGHLPHEEAPSVSLKPVMLFLAR